ncbi:glycosyltransferase [Paracoccus alkenifer]|uniref:Glycosyl transferase family 2 n=1 Tax=Paracoccus alkenifer TaxID=65735 RepID=A0A1H6MZI2_9RHOB|nr:glycosyltransferase [Paracoccus alkenifer]SEI05161.1 Glycosyl transferase family 2 [Paracoccus alkenifer]
MILSVIIPASNEERWLGACLAALVASDPVAGGAEIIVVANGCRDRTAEVARAAIPAAAAAGWSLTVIEREQGGKPAALNHADRVARGEVRAYLDADVTVSGPLMAGLVQALGAREDAAYGSGRPRVTARSRLSQTYARFWARLPFARSTAPGFGLFAVNRAGRARWGEFPTIISDDSYVRMLFQPHERIEVPAPYDWPMTEGFAALVRVRRRQDAGVAEIAARWPELLANEGKPRLGAGGVLRLAAGDPAGFATYAAVSLAVRAGRDRGTWARGR